MPIANNKIKSLIYVVLISMLLAFFLLSCTSEDKKLHQYIKKLKITIAHRHAKKPASELQVPPPVAIVYHSQSQRSPFSEQAGQANKLASPLQVYPLSMLKFVGTLFENGKVFAYVIAPDNKLYQVTIGDKIGIHDGVVTDITPNSVKIVEKDPESSDKGANQIVTLQLRDEYL